MSPSSRIFLLLVPAALVALLAANIGLAFAQTSQGQYVYHRVEIWSLFYRLMVIAFIVGAVVMGTMFYIVWRFRESHPRNKGLPAKQQGGAHH